MAEADHYGDSVQINDIDMKTELRILCVILLSLVGFTALFGGWALMIDPSGEFIQLSIENLKNSPFENFFIPGVILFFVPGLASLFVLPVALKGTSESTNFLTLVAMTTSAWIVVQMIIGLEIEWLHTLYIAAVIAVIYTGIKAELRQEIKT